MTGLNVVYYNARIYFHRTDPCLYLSSDHIPGGGLGRLLWSTTVFLDSKRRSRIEKAVRGSYYPAGCPEKVFLRVQCFVWDGTSQRGYSPHCWGDGSLLDYRAHGSYPAQPALFCHEYGALAHVTTEPVARRAIQHDPEMRTALSVETILDCGNVDRTWPAARRLHAHHSPWYSVSRKRTLSVCVLSLLVLGPRLRYRSRLTVPNPGRIHSCSD